MIWGFSSSSLGSWRVSRVDHSFSSLSLSDDRDHILLQRIGLEISRCMLWPLSTRISATSASRVLPCGEMAVSKTAKELLQSYSLSLGHWIVIVGCIGSLPVRKIGWRWGSLGHPPCRFFLQNSMVVPFFVWDGKLGIWSLSSQTWDNCCIQAPWIWKRPSMHPHTAWLDHNNIVW